MAALFMGGSSMISNEYELAWLVYGVAALGCFWVWTFFTRWMWRYVRELLWLAAAVVLFSPTLVDPGGSEWAPSAIMAVMDIVFKVNNDAWRALADITAYGSLALAVYALFVVIRWLVERYWLKPRQRARAEQQAEQKKAGEQKAAARPQPAADDRREPSLGQAHV